MDDRQPEWMLEFDERQRKEIEFSRVYATQFGHGTDGHNGKIIIATMARLLTRQDKEITELKARHDAKSA